MKVVATRSNMARMLSRMLSIPTITATEMMAMIKPYSIAVAPVRSLRSAINFCTPKPAIPEIPLILRAGRAAVNADCSLQQQSMQSVTRRTAGVPRARNASIPCSAARRDDTAAACSKILHSFFRQYALILLHNTAVISASAPGKRPAVLLRGAFQQPDGYSTACKKFER